MDFHARSTRENSALKARKDTVNMPRVLMGFEACSGAHFLGRAFESNATMLG